MGGSSTFDGVGNSSTFGGIGNSSTFGGMGGSSTFGGIRNSSTFGGAGGINESSEAKESSEAIESSIEFGTKGGAAGSGGWSSCTITSCEEAASSGCKL